jgi:hypothetical protein
MKTNKFLKQYPQLWEPKIGDIIKIRKCINIRKHPTDDLEYKIGDTGIISEIDHSPYFKGENLYKIEFHNKIVSYDMSYVYREEIELYHED